ncbi:MAG: SDR family oxidoreductase [Luminiphilus sp.]|nr:SDR family oxidoreductase [Luminiphilus sp.]
MSNDNLSNKIAVITGGADGIGEGIARTLWGCGARVVIADIQEEKGANLATELGENASFVLLDVTDPSSWHALVTELNNTLGRLDILVNNAGGGGFGNLDQLTFEEWRNIMALNMDSVFLGCKAAAPLLQADGGGSIINISSTNANRAWAMFSGYCSAKAGMTMFSKCVAQHFLEINANVRCNTVHPGPIETPNFKRLTAAEGAEQLLADWQKNNPFTEIGSVEDIGEVVAFLASDAAHYVNASEFVAAGGTLL